MSEVKVEIVRFVEEHQPPIVEAVLVDAWGRAWSFVHKCAYFTAADLDERSSYPQPGVIGCEILATWRDEQGRELCTITTERPWDLEATGGQALGQALGQARFDVLAEQLIP